MSAEPLDRAHLDPDPIRQFEQWFADARDAGVLQPEAMTLATVRPNGRPAARTVLLRGLDDRGFAFYTNLESDKAADLVHVPYAALVFHWRELQRQVRVAGAVSRVPDADAQRYWLSRPHGHRVAAWASPQSRVVADRETLERRVAAIEAEYATIEPPLPLFWGGYVVAVDELELWQGREHRLHDRMRYRRADAPDASYVLERLAP